MADPQLATDKILLNLNNRTDVNKLKENEQFQREAKQKLIEKIKSFIEQNGIKDNKNSLFYDRSHNAVTICGGRGTGKSTFIRNTLEELRDGELKGVNNLLVLPVIDPTLISSKENVLVLIISLIKQAVNKPDSNLAGSLKYKEWHKSLTDLAGGLCQIDGIGSESKYGDEWEDKTYILEKGLEKAHQGLNLERTLNDFFEKTNALLNTNAIVVTFDDIDTQFERGWPVLEAVRKYLTSSGLVILISGDIELYRVLIRRAVIESLGEPILKYDRPSSKQHDSGSLRRWEDDSVIKRVDQLEEQYLLKVLKPENRIHMQSLKRVKESGLYSLSVVSSIWKNKEEGPLEGYIKDSLKVVVGSLNENRLNTLVSAILDFPARTIWQLLKVFEDINSTNGFNSKRYIASLTDIFSSALLKNDILLADVTSSSELRLSLSYWKWLNKADLFTLQSPKSPNYVEQENNQLAIFFMLAASAVRFVDSRDYLTIALRNSFLSHVLKSAPKEISDVFGYSNFQYTDDLDDFVARLLVVGRKALPQDGTLLLHVPDGQNYPAKTALKRVFGTELPKGKGITFIKQNLDVAHTTETVGKNIYLKDWWQVYSNSHEVSKFQSYGGLYNRLSDLEANFGVISNLVYLTKFDVKDTGKSEVSSYVSFPVLLANIIRLMSCTDTEQVDEEIANIFDKDVLYKSGSESGINDDFADVNETELVSSELEHSLKSTAFTEALRIWIESVNNKLKNISTSSLTIELAFSRYLKQVDQISNSRNKISPYLGNYIYRHIVLFLNAILFEETKYNKSLALNSKAPSPEDRVFIENLTKLNFFESEESFKEIPLFELFFSCPLIGIFLYPDTFSISKKRKKDVTEYNLFDDHIRAYLSFSETSEYDGVSYATCLEISTSWGEQEPFKNLWPVLNTVPLILDTKVKRTAELKFNSAEEQEQEQEQAEEKVELDLDSSSQPTLDLTPEREQLTASKLLKRAEQIAPREIAGTKIAHKKRRSVSKNQNDGEE